ncbi:hypothetical protein BDW72DRAFT_202869 [Aspergillus terricola var. indicus]
MAATTPMPTPTVALEVSETTTRTACVPKIYNIPAIDAACAIPKHNTYHPLMTSCCGPANVIAYTDCSYYCLAQGQTIGELAECLIRGTKGGRVWCNADANTTATGAASITTTATDEELDIPAGINGVEEQAISVPTALLLLLMVLSGVRPFI